MDIKTISLRSYSVVSKRNCGLPTKQSREVFYALPFLVSDEIIDFVEVQTNPPVLSRQTSYQKHTDRSATGKGTLINTWI
jgi:hypothetical protein